MWTHVWTHVWGLRDSGCRASGGGQPTHTCSEEIVAVRELVVSVTVVQPTSAALEFVLFVELREELVPFSKVPLTSVLLASVPFK